MHELSPAAAHLPHAVVGIAASAASSHSSTCVATSSPLARRHAELLGTVDRVDQFAVDVELQLSGRRVADTNGGGTFVSRQPRKLVFVEPPLSPDAVHDLDILGIAGDRADHPVAPGGRLLDVSSGH